MNKNELIIQLNNHPALIPTVGSDSIYDGVRGNNKSVSKSTILIHETKKKNKYLLLKRLL